jgi:hypothetical protein
VFDDDRLAVVLHDQDVLQADAVAVVVDDPDDLVARRIMRLDRRIAGLEGDVLAEVEADAELARLRQDRLPVTLEGAGGRGRGGSAVCAVAATGAAAASSAAAIIRARIGTSLVLIVIRISLSRRLQTQGQRDAEVAARLGVGVETADGGAARRGHRSTSCISRRRTLKTPTRAVT